MGGAIKNGERILLTEHAEKVVIRYPLFSCLHWPDQYPGISGPGKQGKEMLERRLSLGPGGLS